MINIRLHEITTKLDHTFKMVKDIDEDELKSHFARYLCILTSGYIEESIKIILKSYALKNASPSIVNFVTNQTKKITNLNSEKIELLLNNFNSEYKDIYVSKLEDEEKNSIDSVIANRNNIAHGKNVGISYVSISRWYKDIKSIVSKIRASLSL